MIRETICLFDTDLLYGRMVLQALQEETFLPGSYAYFSEMDALYSFLISNQVTVLLLEKNKEQEFYQKLSEEGLSEEQLKGWQEKILLLTEEPGSRECELYKYLPRQEFGTRLRNWRTERFGDSSKEKQEYALSSRCKQVLTGYITFGGANLGKFLAGIRQSAVGGLVLNLEIFAYTSPHIKPKKNMSDLIYLATLDQLSKVSIKDYVYTIENIDCVEPIMHYSDGYELDNEAVSRLVEFLRTLPYERIILITDCRHRGVARLLELCDEVKVEEPGSPIEQHKNSLMRQMLHLEGREKLLGKLEQIKREQVYG